MNREKLQEDIAKLRQGKLNAGPIATSMAKRIVQQHNERSSRKMNANETFTLARALEIMQIEAALVPTSELVLAKVLPRVGGQNVAIEYYRYADIEDDGIAKVGLAPNGKDIPMVDLSKREQSQRVVTIAAGFRLSQIDIERAAFSGDPISAEGLIAANRMYDRALDKLLGFGDGENIADGLFNKTLGTGAGQVRHTAATSAHFTGALNATAASGMFADLTRLVAEYQADCQNLFPANVLLLPPQTYSRIAQAHLELTGQTVLAAFQAANPGIEVVLSADLVDIDGTGGAHSRGVLLCNRPDVVCAVETRPFSFEPAQMEALNVNYFGFGRSAGAVLKRSIGVRYLSAIY